VVKKQKIDFMEETKMCQCPLPNATRLCENCGKTDDSKPRKKIDYIEETKGQPGRRENVSRSIAKCNKAV